MWSGGVQERECSGTGLVEGGGILLRHGEYIAALQDGHEGVGQLVRIEVGA